MANNEEEQRRQNLEKVRAKVAAATEKVLSLTKKTEGLLEPIKGREEIGKVLQNIHSAEAHIVPIGKFEQQVSGAEQQSARSLRVLVRYVDIISIEQGMVTTPIQNPHLLTYIEHFLADDKEMPSHEKRWITQSRPDEIIITNIPQGATYVVIEIQKPYAVCESAGISELRTVTMPLPLPQPGNGEDDAYTLITITDQRHLPPYDVKFIVLQRLEQEGKKQTNPNPVTLWCEAEYYDHGALVSAEKNTHSQDDDTAAITLHIPHAAEMMHLHILDHKILAVGPKRMNEKVREGKKYVEIEIKLIQDLLKSAPSITLTIMPEMLLPPALHEKIIRLKEVLSKMGDENALWHSPEIDPAVLINLQDEVNRIPELRNPAVRARIPGFEESSHILDLWVNSYLHTDEGLEARKELLDRYTVKRGSEALTHIEEVLKHPEQLRAEPHNPAGGA